MAACRAVPSLRAACAAAASLALGYRQVSSLRTGLCLRVRGVVQADDGYLYPLEKAFFYVHKPPMLITHEEIDGVEFMRQGGGVLAASAKTFDLNVRVNLGTVRVIEEVALSVSTGALAWMCMECDGMIVVANSASQVRMPDMLQS